MTLKLFRYCGSKTRMLKYYQQPPKGTQRVVEPYLGSGAYSLASNLPCLGYDSNSDIIEIWKWLKGVTANDLERLDAYVRDCVNRDKNHKPDVREMILTAGEMAYTRINITGAMTGQLTSWKIYPQHKLPIQTTIDCLGRLADIETENRDALSYQHKDGDMLFIDPPYLGTKAGYVEKGKANHESTYDPECTRKLIESTDNPIILTYGDGASQIFPEYDWQCVATRMVPNLRNGGTVPRNEFVSYIHWRK
jgi:site-specific DNA-adenine methylase